MKGFCLCVHQSVAASASRREGKGERVKRKRGKEAREQCRGELGPIVQCKKKKQELPAEAGSQTLSDFQPPSTDTILSGGFGEKRCTEVCLNSSSGTVISGR